MKFIKKIIIKLKLLKARRDLATAVNIRLVARGKWELLNKRRRRAIDERGLSDDSHYVAMLTEAIDEAHHELKIIVPQSEKVCALIEGRIDELELDLLKL